MNSQLTRRRGHLGCLFIRERVLALSRHAGTLAVHGLPRRLALPRNQSPVSSIRSNRHRDQIARLVEGRLATNTIFRRTAEWRRRVTLDLNRSRKVATLVLNLGP
jgi:hypothetical protein